MRTLRALVLCCLAFASTSASAHPDVDAGKAAYARGEYRPALARLEEAERSPNVTEDDLVDIHWFRGASFYALGKKDDANKSFDELVALRPLYTPNKLETPPDVRAAFKKRVDAWQKVHGINVGAPVIDAANLTVPLDGKLTDADHLQVYARPGGQKSFKQFALPIADGKAVGPLGYAPLWELSGKAGALELVLEVQNVRGTPIARSGDAKEPLSLPVSKEQVDAAVTQLKPPAPPPDQKPPEQATDSGAQKTNPDGTSAAPGKPEGKKSSPLAGILGGGGGVLLGLTVIGLVMVLVTGIAAASSWTGFAYIYQDATKVGAQVGPNYALYQRVWLPLQVAAVAFSSITGIVGLVALFSGIVAIGMLVGRALAG